MQSSSLPIAAAPSRRAFGLALLIATVTFAVFCSTLSHQLLYWDDVVSIVANKELNPPTLHSLGEFWRHPVAGYNRSYVPVNYTLWWLLAHIARVPEPNGAGMTFLPAPFHVLNLTFHLIAAVLVFVFLRRLVRSDWPAAAGTLLFALHPLQVEPVCWASNMYTPLSGMLALAAVVLYLRFSDARLGRERGAGPSHRARQWLVLIAAVVCFTLALLSKPTLVLLPLVIGAIEVLINGRRLRDCTPLLAWLPIAIADVLVTRHVHPGLSAFKPPLYARPFIAADALSFYFQKLLMPIRLVTDYSRSPRWAVQQPGIWVAWIVPTAVLAVCWVVRRRAPWLLCGLIIFVLGALPMLGLVPFDYQLYSTVADRYVWFPMLGPAVAVAFAVRWSTVNHPQRHVRTVVTASCCAVLALLAFLSYLQTAYWHDTGTLLAGTLELNPRSLMANLEMGRLLLKGGPEQLDKALAHLHATEELDPDDPWVMYEQGTALLRKGEPVAAAELFRRSQRLKPDEAATQYMLGRASAAAGDRRGAVAAFLETLRRFPDYADTRVKLAEVFAEAGDVRDAIGQYDQYLRAHPDSAEVHAALSKLVSGPQQTATDLR